MNNIELKNELIKTYSNIPLNEKRDEFNKELLIVSSLTEMLLSIYGQTCVTQLNNYNKETDYLQTEEEVLTNNYSGIVDVKNNLLLLIDYIKNNK